MEVALTPSRIRTARALALAADLLQIVVFPTFAQGIFSPFEDILDGVVAVAMVWLLGWHWVFLPSFLTELVPVADVIPTWTAAVWFVTSGKVPPPARTEGPSEPVPPRELPPRT